jgi:hypothetical protein
MRPNSCLIWARIVALSIVAIFFITSAAHAVPGKLDRPAVATAKGADYCRPPPARGWCSCERGIICSAMTTGHVASGESASQRR